jgi:mannose-6-phosphate isomerase
MIPIFRPPEVHPKGWGEEIWLANNDKYCGKILKINKGAKFSLHYHLQKIETFHIFKGKIWFRFMDLKRADIVSQTVVEGKCIDIPIGLPHQIEALEDSIIIEVSTHHEDSDSYRIEKGDSQK